MRNSTGACPLPQTPSTPKPQGLQGRRARPWRRDQAHPPTAPHISEPARSRAHTVLKPASLQSDARAGRRHHIWRHRGLQRIARRRGVDVRRASTRTPTPDALRLTRPSSKPMRHETHKRRTEQATGTPAPPHTAGRGSAWSPRPAASKAFTRLNSCSSRACVWSCAARWSCTVSCSDAKAQPPQPRTPGNKAAMRPLTPPAVAARTPAHKTVRMSLRRTVPTDNGVDAAAAVATSDTPGRTPGPPADCDEPAAAGPGSTRCEIALTDEKPPSSPPSTPAKRAGPLRLGARSPSVGMADHYSSPEARLCSSKGKIREQDGKQLSQRRETSKNYVCYASTKIPKFFSLRVKRRFLSTEIDSIAVSKKSSGLVLHLLCTEVSIRVSRYGRE